MLLHTTHRSTSKATTSTTLVAPHTTIHALPDVSAHLLPPGRQASCEPTIVIAGMPRSGTSFLRLALGKFEGVHIGVEKELWKICWQHWRSIWRTNYECDTVRSVHRVVSHPWMFQSWPCLASSLRRLPHATFVLLLRDPVERAVSTFYHSRTPFERQESLKLLRPWADKVHRTGQFVDTPKDREGRFFGYYTLKREEWLRHILDTGRRNFIVGLTEEMGWVEATLRQKLGLVVAETVERPHTNNTSSRHTEPVLDDYVISAFGTAARRVTNFERLSELITTAGCPTTAHELRCAWRTTSGAKDCGAG